MNESTFISLFRGIGGFDLGLTRAGWKCVWSNDNIEYANKIYHKHFPEVSGHDGNIEDIKAEDIPDHTLLCGGFPCQPFSLAGKRQGFEDIRGTCFFEIVRIAAVKRPTFLFLENVDGLRSHNNGETFETILRTLGNMGYWWEYQVLNSRHFSVPQNRERVFIIGHLRERSTEKIFPITEGQTISYEANEGEQGNGEGLRSCISPTLRATYHKGYETRGPLISPTIYARYGALRNAGGPYIMSALIQSQGAESHIETRNDGVSHCLKGQGAGWAANHVLFLEEEDIRRFTPKECERLQGFPDSWTEGVSDTQRYKCLGNAVTVPVIEFLGRHLLACNQRSEG